MVAGIHRPTKAVIDCDAIRWNISQEKKRLPEDTLLYAVVKADGYGHGAVQTAKAARQAGANGFCVALLDEALELREAGITEPIFILGIVEAAYADLMAEQQLSVAVSSLEWLQEAEQVLREKTTVYPLIVHFAIDTGMGRIGLKTAEEIQQCEAYARQSSHLYLEGVFTHFATADEKDDQLFQLQQSRFCQLIKSFVKKPEIVHTANSATALFHQSFSSNMVRFGIALYGLNPSGNQLSTPYSLKPALQLKSRLIFVKQMSEGETVGYGATYRAKEGEWIGTVPIGYADGWTRGLQGQTVLVEGERCEIVGRVCMDQCMIRLPQEKPVGTEVVLIGKSGTDEITMQEIAEKLHTIHYEVACLLSSRIPRTYEHVC